MRVIYRVVLSVLFAAALAFLNVDFSNRTSSRELAAGRYHQAGRTARFFDRIGEGTQRTASTSRRSDTQSEPVSSQPAPSKPISTRK